MSSHCDAAAKRANVFLRCRNREVVSRRREMILPLYMVHCWLEFCGQFWCPQSKNNVKKERVKKRATKVIHGTSSDIQKTQSVQLIKKEDCEVT